MAPQPCRKGAEAKTTMTTKVNICVQGNARVQKTTAAKVTKNKNASTADSEEKSKFDIFHPFGTRLPRELVAMIVEEAADCGPAIAYVDCMKDKSDPLRLVLTNGKDGSVSKFKEMMRLAKLLPDFQSIIERRFGQPLDKNVARNPILGVRKEKDLMVFQFDRGNRLAIRFFNWITMALLSVSRPQLAPGVRNVGVQFNHGNCNGSTFCYGCTVCVNAHSKMINCAWELAVFCQSLSHADNVFILVLLRGPDVIGNNINKHANLMKALIADSKTIRRHVSFQDANRTWVEVSRRTPLNNQAMIEPDVLIPIFSLCVEARRVNTNQVARIVGAEARRHVRFRVLVASRWKDATLKI
ncbi:hypothetical protein LZ32DRAFT_641320 [Colletotrichum eremochloae]|nr:hypothetical protein LZ32DRAFT_641320 [Colletotrichum eremochloae]